MFSSIRGRLWLTYAFLIGIVLAIVAATLVLFLIRNPYETRMAAQRLKLISTVVFQRAETISGLGLDRIQRAAERVDASYNVRVLVIDRSGEILVDSQAAAPGQVPAVDLLIERGNLALPYFRDNRGMLWLYTLRTLDDGNLLVLAAPRPRPPIVSIMRDEFFRPFVQAGLIALLLALLLAFWMAGWVSAPLRRIAGAARQVANGQAVQIPLEGPVEAQVLARAFNEMAESVQASQRAQRDFVANVSHELKTPLTSIQGFSQAIMEGVAATPDAIGQAAQIIYIETGRMLRMVMDLLDLARFDSGIARLDKAAVDLNRLLAQVVERLDPQARRRQVELVTEIEALPAIDGDLDRLAQVFTNLLDNAIKHTPEGGRVGVKAAKKNGWVEITVADSGGGIPAEEIPRIFERFYHIDKSRQGGAERGTGLGLAIAREIILAHAGTIQVQSEIGRGSNFVVNLPITPLRQA